MGYGPIKATVGPALEMLYQPWIRGEENIPAEGAAILASNHLAVIDSFFLPLLVDREVAFIGKADYFTGKGVKGWAVKNFMKTGNADGKEEKDFFGNLLTPYKIITRKPIVPTDEEIMTNSRARSAKLRIAERK